jgi:hypothetical protein
MDVVGILLLEVSFKGSFDRSTSTFTDQFDPIRSPIININNRQTSTIHCGSI